MQPHEDTGRSKRKARIRSESKQAQNWPMFVLIQVLLLTYWGNLDKSFPFSELLSFICKMGMLD